MFRYIKKLLIPPQPLLGRWKLKHNSVYCEDYIQNYYGEPGYPNTKKEQWIHKITEIENSNKRSTKFKN